MTQEKQPKRADETVEPRAEPRTRENSAKHGLTAEARAGERAAESRGRLSVSFYHASVTLTNMSSRVRQTRDEMRNARETRI